MIKTETSQVVKHAKNDANINTGGIIKQLGCVMV